MAMNGDKPSGATTRGKRAAKRKAATAALTAEEEIVVRSGRTSAASVWGFLQKGTVRHSEITDFLRQLIMLIEAGTPILRSLKTLAERGKSMPRRALVADIAQYVEAGNPLWQCFDRHPRYFTEVEVNLIKASEASGTLATVLRRIADYREERDLLAKRVRGAMIYPVILVLASFGVMLLLTKFVVPEFVDMFEKQHITIPPLTQSFLTVANLFGTYWWIPVAVVLLLILIYKGWYVRDELRRLRADRIKLMIPIIGPIIHKNAVVELTRTMALLLRSGLSMMATLNLTRKAINNRAVAETLQSVRDSVEQGGGLEAPLRQAEPVIPAVVTDMFVTGEESGRVDAVAEQIAHVYEEEVKIAVTSLGETLQPVFTVFIGIIVMILFVSLYYPIVSMIESISSAGS